MKSMKTTFSHITLALFSDLYIVFNLISVKLIEERHWIYIISKHLLKYQVFLSEPRNFVCKVTLVTRQKMDLGKFEKWRNGFLSDDRAGNSSWRLALKCFGCFQVWPITQDMRHYLEHDNSSSDRHQDDHADHQGDVILESSRWQFVYRLCSIESYFLCPSISNYTLECSQHILLLPTQFPSRKVWLYWVERGARSNIL